MIWWYVKHHFKYQYGRTVYILSATDKFFPLLSRSALYSKIKERKSSQCIWSRRCQLFFLRLSLWIYVHFNMFVTSINQRSSSTYHWKFRHLWYRYVRHSLNILKAYLLPVTNFPTLGMILLKRLPGTFLSSFQMECFFLIWFNAKDSESFLERIKLL
jgi:hypothetical protein